MSTTEIGPLATASDRLGEAFRQTMVAARRLRGRETHRPGQLSYAQFGLLSGLSRLRESSARELADEVELTPATVTQMLDSLEDAGLVERARSGRDRRVVLSVLTDRGAAAVTDREARLKPRWRAALQEFSDPELEIAARVLERLADYFDALREE